LGQATRAQAQFEASIFTVHFTYRQNLSNDTKLTDVTAEIGLVQNEALAVLESQRFTDASVHGEPAIAFSRRRLVTEEQGTENQKQILQQLAEETN